VHDDAMNVTRHAGRTQPFSSEHRFPCSLLSVSKFNRPVIRPPTSKQGKPMLTITGITHGKCTWCLERTEVVNAQFRDGLTGTFCKKHLWQALKVRCDASAAPKPANPQEERSVT
jgi:hypothetical protein